MSKELAYFKYTGKDVENGYLDARKTADTLIAIDHLIRYFLYKKDENLNDLEIEIPVRIEKGSWIAWIPEQADEWIKLGIATGGGAYLIQAAKEMAKNDVGDFGLKDLIKWSIKGIKWVFVLSKHLGEVAIKQIKDGKYQEREELQLIGVPDKNGDIMWVPKEYLELYTNIPPRLLSDIVQHVSEGRKLEIDFSESEKGDNDDYDSAAIIDLDARPIFREDKDDEIVLPELKHNQYVEIEGHLSRGNEFTNTFGFKYKNHILTIIPKNGQIISDKERLFSNCVVRGIVSRLDRNGEYKLYKPRIIYVDIIDNEKTKNTLFD